MAIKGATKSNYEGIMIRLMALEKMLKKPITIREICEQTGWNYRTVYRDIFKLINLGYKVQNKLKKYWIKPD
jgi:DNA-binding IclR family transcriptional regulator